MTDESDPKNITSQVEMPNAPPTDTDKKDATKTNADKQHAGEDHPYIDIIDIAVDESIRYCQEHDIPPPKTSLWNDLGRPCMNRALWHYCPDSAEPDVPIINLLMGIGCMVLCFSPPILYLIRSKLDEQSAEQEELEQEEQPETETETDEAVIYELKEDDLPPAVAPKRVAIGGEE